MGCYEMGKVLIPLSGDDVAPRFDLALEVLIAVFNPLGQLFEERTLVFPEVSAEALCQLIITEKVDTVVCCGIEDEYYQYLNWKKVTVISSVIGPARAVLDRLLTHTLEEGAILFPIHPE